MKLHNSYFLLLSLLMFGCTPANIVKLPVPSDDHSSKLLIYRESAHNAKGVGMIFGIGKQDHLILPDKSYTNIRLLPGEHKIFIRSSQADRPFVHSIKINAGESKCIKAYADPANYAKAMFIITAYMSSNFKMEEVECPSNQKLNEYQKISAH